ncbi:hypothetical protein CANCADRAFT_32227 [Tortispora caseinolytica NRRL Y-17796]|uniref:DUF866-domain-containing protein n=1 Tax=Tortispora caseinolytica NRRL Y-17796 TaxID=767744 RepID=A0A1E4TAA6_9ASCO|nr:hypothetical protein CANCADRAFT_32227 [Tortispora caseinolytica NRRL Y-17796]
MLGVTISAEFDGIKELSPEDDGDFQYEFTIQCTSCRETHKNNVIVSRNDAYELSKGRSAANFVFKCQFCGKEGSINIEKGPKPLKNDSKMPLTFLELDCRGCDITNYYPGNSSWRCTGESGQVFGDIDISEYEWYDYDEKANVEVSIVNIKFDIIKL